MANSALKKILITGAGTGFGYEAALRLAEKGFDVIAAVEIYAQGVAKQMIKRGAGRIVWVSSREGLNVNPFTGIYAASKHSRFPGSAKSRTPRYSASSHPALLRDDA
jgi:short-subunit dehydrogenase